MKNVFLLLCHPSSLGLAVILSILSIISVPVIASDSDNNVAQVESAIIELCQTAPKHRAMREPEWRRELAKAIVDSGELYDEDPFLILVIMFCESSLRPSVRGKLGERGMGQLHGIAANGCDFSTLQGQAACTARWLARSRASCKGSDRQTIARYASGRTCEPARGGRLDSLVKHRMKIYSRLVQVLR